MEKLTALSPSPPLSPPKTQGQATPPQDKTTPPKSQAASTNQDGDANKAFPTQSDSGTKYHPVVTHFRPTRILPYVNLEDQADQSQDASMSCDTPLATPSTDSHSSNQDAHDAVAHGNSRGHTSSQQQEMDCTLSPTDLTSHFLLQGGKGGVAPSEGGTLAISMTDFVQSALDAVAQDMEPHDLDKMLFEKLNAKLMSQKDSSPTVESRQESESSLGKGSSGSGVPYSAALSQDLPVLSSSYETGRASLLSLDTTASGSSETVSVKVLNETLAFGRGSSFSSVNLDGLRISSISDLTPYQPDSGFDVIESLFSNWPAIVTTILGLDPSSLAFSSSKPNHASSTPPTKSSHAPSLSCPHLSSVHLLDSFTTDLFLNCSDRVIEFLVSSIIRKLNSALDNAERHHFTLLLQDIDYSDPERSVTPFLEAGELGVAVLVGRRFLESVVRVLALEHSRVKNRFLEMRQQQARQDGKC